MSICASGASHAKSTSAASIVVDAAFVQSLLPPGLAWLYPYLPYMHGLEIGNVGTFCTADPPTWTVPSAADIFNFLAGGPISQYQLVDKFIQDVTKAYLWYQLCECTSGVTPDPPTAPGAPANLPAVNPPAVVSLPISAPCKSIDFVPLSMAQNQTFNRGDLVLDNLPFTAVQVVLTTSAATGTLTNVRYTFTWQDQTVSPFVGGNQWQFTVPSGTTLTKAIPLQSGFNRLHFTISTLAGTGTVTGEAIAYGYCGEVPGAPVTPCCPPDPILMARVNQILDLVTLVQRQAVPFGYVPGAVHAGLTGSGSLSVSGLIGCKVDMTTIPASYGVEFGTPDEHFDLGFVTFGSPDGYPTSKRLDHQPTLLLPARCGAYTDLAYTLAPGVVATITELAREA